MSGNLCIGKPFNFSDPETSSDSEEDALRRLKHHLQHPPDTLTIQADGPPLAGETTFTYLKDFTVHFLSSVNSTIATI